MSKYDYNVIVIGAGSAGLVSSYIASAVKAKVLLIEKYKMGGDCLNTGCVPSKAFIRSAKMMSYARRAKEFGFKKTEVKFEFQDIMKRVQTIIKSIEPNDSRDRYTKLGVDCIDGIGKLVSPHKVEVKGKILTARSIIIATGAHPMVPNIEGLDKINYLTSENLWNLKKLPRKLVILGGGPIGSEMAQAFSRLGSEVTIVEMSSQIMSREDNDVVQLVKERFKKEGIKVLVDHKAINFKSNKLICDHKGKEKVIEFDQVLLALVRSPNIN